MVTGLLVALVAVVVGAWVVAAVDWNAIMLGLISGTLAGGAGAWGIRRQFSGTTRTSSGDGMLDFGEALMGLQQASLTRAHERCAVLEVKVEQLETGWAAARVRNHALELENAELRARLARYEQPGA